MHINMNQVYLACKLSFARLQPDRGRYVLYNAAPNSLMFLVYSGRITFNLPPVVVIFILERLAPSTQDLYTVSLCA